jgi:hypothetical protein
MPLLCSILLLAAAVGAQLPPFSWEKIPVFAFPGASTRFMDAGELLHFSKFQQLVIWGINASCINITTGTQYPAQWGGDKRCFGTCIQAVGALENQTFALNMDTQLQLQALALKASGAPLVLGYFNGAVAELYFEQQEKWCRNASFQPQHLALASLGEVDCFHQGCNFVGMEYRAFDYRQKETRDFWVDTILPALIASPHIDGVFLDEMDLVINNRCAHWHCSPTELADLTAGYELLLDAALAKAATLGKFLSVSITSTLTNNPQYHRAITDSIKRHSSGARYYEFFAGNSQGMDHLATLAYEAQTLGIPVHAHAESITHNPSFVELALFLLGMGNNSFFSYSPSWTFEDFPWLPEFDLPLGAPQGPAVERNATVPPWEARNGTSLICGLVPSPGASGPGAAFVGSLPSAEACEAAVRSNASFTAWTWVTPLFGEASWRQGCYGLLVEQQPHCLSAPPQCGTPCFTQAAQGLISAAGVAFNQSAGLSRTFEHLTVTYNPKTSQAWITPLK